MTGVVVTAAFMMSVAAEAAVPVCMAVSEGDARAILGPSAKRTKDPSGCGWQTADHPMKQMNVARVGVAAMFEIAREDGTRKGATKVETGLGGAAFSTIPSAHKGARASICMLKDGAVLVVDIDGFEPGGAESHLPQVRNLVRKLGPGLGKE